MVQLMIDAGDALKKFKVYNALLLLDILKQLNFQYFFQFIYLLVNFIEILLKYLVSAPLGTLSLRPVWIQS